MTLIRYPGSKAKLYRPLNELMPSSVTRPLWACGACEYREPFFGAGAVGFRILKDLHHKCSVWLNDIDEEMSCLWLAVRDEPQELIELVRSFTPTIEAFYDFKERDGECLDGVAPRGFRKLALHRMSISGFGAKSGGPIGGKEQLGKQYQVGCRWTPDTIASEIARLSNRMSYFAGLKITHGDFAPLVIDAPAHAFIYCDPPYYEKGHQLYKYAMSQADHERLAEALRAVKCQWVLSYDDHQEIRRLYSWATIKTLPATYSNAVAKPKSQRPVRMEVAITP